MKAKLLHNFSDRKINIGKYHGLLFSLCLSVIASMLLSNVVNAQSSQAVNVLNANNKASDDIKEMLHSYDEKIYFTENKGQWPDNVLYKADFHLGQAIATKDGMLVGTFAPADVDAKYNWSIKEEEAIRSGVKFDKPEPAEKGHGWLMNFVNHSPGMTIETQDKHTDVFNYFLANTSQTSVNNYQEVWYKNVYNNVDVRYYPSKTGTLEYDVVCKPGFNKNEIAIQLTGIDKITVSKDGHLVLKTSVGDMDFPAPVAYQAGADKKQIPVKVKYYVTDGNILHFTLGNYDASKTLIIDPIALRWATWMTNNSAAVDHGHCIWVDPTDGGIYVVSRFAGSGLITVNAFQNSYAGGSSYDLCIGKYYEPASVGGAGTRVWQTYLGGTGEDNPYTILQGLDSAIYIAGYTASTNFPLIGGTKFGSTANGINNGSQTANNIFITKIWKDGQSIKSAVVGGNGEDYAYDMGMDAFGDITLCGFTSSTNLKTLFPATSASNTNSGDADVLVFQITSNFEAINWMRNYGGSGRDIGTIMQQNPVTNEIYVAGSTASSNFPVSTNARQKTLGGTEDGFIQKLDATGNTVWSSYFNSASKDSTVTLCMNFNTTYDALFFGGLTTGLGTNNTPSSTYQTSIAGGQDFFCAVMDTNQTFVASTYIGGSGNEVNLMGLNVDLNNDVYLFGYTPSTNFPVTSDALQSTNMGQDDKVFFRLNTGLSSLLYSTYYGGTDDDYDPVGERGIKFSNCRIYTIVTAESPNIPLTQGAITTHKLSGTTIYEPGIVEWSNPPDLLGNTLSGNQKLCAGQTPGNISGSVPTYSLPNIVRYANTGSSSDSTDVAYPINYNNTGVTYQWEESTDSINWTGISGATTQNLSGSLIGPVFQKTYLRRLIGSDDACVVAGAAASIITVNVLSVTANVNNGCYNQNNGSITITSSSGTAPYTYSWDNSSTAQERTGLAPGTYKVTVTDHAGCSAAGSFNITNPTQLTASANSTATTNCQPNASASVTPSGGTSPYTYSWGGGEGNEPNIFNLGPGTYNVTVTDADGCTATASTIIAGSAIPTVTVNSPTICPGGSANLLAGGASTYTWSPVTNLTPTTGASVTASPTATSTYTVTGTASDGCTAIAVSVVTVAPNPSISAGTAATICAGTPTGLTASCSANCTGIAYSWSPVATLNQTTGAGVTASPTTTTTYTVIGTNSNTCTASATVKLTVTALPTVSISVQSGSTTYCAGTGGSASIKASGATTYSWLPAAGLSKTSGATITASPTVTTTYTVTGTTGSCSNTTTVVFTVNIPVQVAVTSPSTCKSVPVNITASNVTSYKWSPSTNLNQTTGATVSATLTTTTSYTVTGTDGNGCTSTAQSKVTVNTPVQVAVTSPSTCKNVPVNITGSNVTSYTWSPATNLNQTTGATVSATITTTTSYTVTGTDGNGCTSTAQSKVTVNTPVQITVNSPSTCNGVTVGLTASNAVTYTWTPSAGLSTTTGASVNVVAPTSPATYTVTGTDGNGCTTTAISTVTINTPAQVTVNSPSTCPGVTVALTASNNETSYKWSPSAGLSATTGISVNVLTPASPATYTVTGSDANGCTSTAISTVTINTPAQVTVNSPSTCPGVTVALTASNNETSYKWSPSAGLSATTGISVNVLTPTSPATYTVTGTDANGCTSTAISHVTINTPVQVTVNSPSTCPGVTVALTASNNETSYSWSPSAGLSATTGISVNVLTPTSPATYTVTGTDANGCTSAAISTVAIYTPIQVAVNSPSTCPGVSVNLTGSNDVSYTWLPAAGLSATAGTTVTVVTPTSPATYTVTGTDGNGCKTTAVSTVTISPLPLATTGPNQFFCQGTGGVTIGAATVAGDSYSWAPSTGLSSATVSNPTANPTATTTYTLTETINATTCSVTNSVVVTVNDTPAVNITGPSIVCSYNNASLTANASAGSGSITSYQWYVGGSQITGATNSGYTATSSGSYTVVVTNSNNCTALSQPFVVTQLTPITVPGNITNVSCHSLANGAVNITPTGGDGDFTYSWSNGTTTISTSEDISGLIAGTYTVTVTDNNSCTASNTFTVSQPDTLKITSRITDVICYGGNTGAIGASVSGGTSTTSGLNKTYNYFWSNGTSSNSIIGSITGLKADIYSVTVVDGNGCSISQADTITQPNPMHVVATIKDDSCHGTANGEIILTVTGGTPNDATDIGTGNNFGFYNYIWSNNSTTSTISGLTAASYIVTVTDANGCVAVDTFTVTQPDTLLISGTPTALTCYGSLNGAVNISVSGGTVPYTYSWSNDSTTQNLSNIAAAIYIVTVTDKNGCFSTNTFTVTQPDTLEITKAPITKVICNGLTNGAIDITVSGGTTTYTYSWSNGNTTANNDNIGEGTYTVLVTDANDCTATGSYYVGQPLPLAIVDTVMDVTSCSLTTVGSINIGVTGGVPAYTFAWSPKGGSVISTSQDLTGAAPGIYCVTVTDNNQCNAFLCDTIKILSSNPPSTIPPTFTYDSPCDPNSTVTVGIAASGITGGIPPYAVLWSNGATTDTITTVPAGTTYFVTVTDSKGCTGSSSVGVEPNSPVDVLNAFQPLYCSGTGSDSITIQLTGDKTPITIVVTSEFFDNVVTTITGITSDNFTIPVTTTFPGFDIDDITATDAAGCTSSFTGLLIISPTPVSVGFFNVDSTSCNTTNGQFEYFIQGGNPFSENLFTTYHINIQGPGVNVNALTDDSVLTGLGAGTYTLTIFDSIGCKFDTSITIYDHLPTYDTVTAIICQRQSYTVGSSTFSQAGSYNITLTNSFGCDSIVTLNLTVLDTSATTLNPIICQRQSYTVGSQTFTTTGTYTIPLTNIAGCDSIVTLNLTVLDTIATTLNPIICQRQSYTVGSQTFNQTGTYIIPLTNIAGCDSIVTLNLTVLDTSATTLNPIICQRQSYTVGSQTFNTTGTYTIPLTNVAGCDSIVTLNLTVLDTSATTLNPIICQRQSYTVGSQTFTTTGTYTIPLTNIAGCDSIVTLNLTVLDTSATTLNPTICSGSSYTVGSQSFNATGNYTIVLTNAAGCDSVVTLNLTVDQLSVSNLSQPVYCAGTGSDSVSVQFTGGTPPYAIVVDGLLIGQLASVTGITSNSVTIAIPVIGADLVEATVSDATGCSSSDYTYVASPTPITVQLSNIDSTSCNANTGQFEYNIQGGAGPNSSYFINIQGLGVNFDAVFSDSVITGLAAGTYALDITDFNGCTLDTTITIYQHNSTYDTVKATICQRQSYTVGNQSFNTPGSFNITLTNSVGCDSIVTLNLTVLDTSATTLNPIICQRQSYTVGGQSFNTTGTYTIQLTNAAGCDSIVTLNLTVLDTIATTLNPIICQRQSYTVGSQTFNQTGTYVIPLTNIAGCDSIVTLNLTVLDTSATTLNPIICQRQSYTVGSQSFNTTGTYTIPLTNAAGCDSIVTLNLTVLDTIATTLNPTICQGSSYTVGSQSFNTTGTYTIPLTNAAGCDSIVTLNLTVDQLSVTLTKNATCQLLNTCQGFVAADVTGGTPVFNYTWAGPLGFNGSDNDTVKNLCNAGIYKVTVTDGNQCAATANTGVVCNTCPVGNASIIGVDSICSSSLPAILTVTSLGTPQSYTWSTGSTTDSIHVSASGIYSVLVIFGDCQTTLYDTVTVKPQPEVTPNHTDVACFGACNGTITLTVTNVTSHTTSWTGANNYTNSGDHLSSLCAGTYYYTVTADGCTVTGSITINQATSSLAATPVPVSTKCYGSADGSLSLTITGGTQPYTIDWASTVANNDTIYNLSTGSYCYTVYDANRCSVTGCSTVGQPDSLNITVEKQDLTCSQPDTSKCKGFVTYTQGGYHTDCHGGNPGCIRDADFPIAFPNGITIGCDSTIYFATSADVAAFLPQGTGPQKLDKSYVNPTRTSYRNIFAGQVLTLALTVGFVDSVAGFAPSTSHLKDLIYTGAGAFNGWTVQQILDTANAVLGNCPSLYQPTDLNDVVDNINGNYDGGTTDDGYLKCSGSASSGTTGGTCNGSITVSVKGGTGQSTIAWANNGVSGFNPQNLCAGTYYFTISDANGCQKADSVTINTPAPIVSNIQGVNPTNCVPGSCNGNASVNPTGGVAPYKVEWSNEQTTDTIKAICAAKYYVTITDANKCSTIDSVTLTTTNCTCPVVTNTQTNATCYNSCNGAATIHIPNASLLSYTVAWSGVTSTDTTISNLCAGQYCYTVSFPGINCSQNGCVTITQPGSPSAGPDTTICIGTSAQLTASGGTFYLWAPPTGLSNDSIFNPIANPTVTTTYTVTISNATGDLVVNGNFQAGNTGFTTDYTFVPHQLPPPYVQVPGNNGLWPETTYAVDTDSHLYHAHFHGHGHGVGNTDGPGKFLIVNGSTIPKQIVWQENVTNVVPHQDYYFSAWISTQVELSPAQLNFTIDGTLINPTLTAPADSNYWIQVYAVWNSGSNTTAQIQIVNGNTIADGNDFGLDDIVFTTVCSTIADVVVNVDNIQTTVAKTDVTCYGGNNGTAKVTSATGGVAPYNYKWSNGSTVDSASNLTKGPYYVTVGDAHGCSVIDTVKIGQPTIIVSNISGTNPTNCVPGQCNGTATVTPSGGEGTYTITWSNGQTGSPATGLCANIKYYVTISDLTGCSIVDSIKLITKECECPVVLNTHTDATCFSACNGSVTVHIANVKTTNYSVAWDHSNSNAPTDTTLRNLCAGTYCYTVTFPDINCSQNGCVTVGQNPEIIAFISCTLACYNECNALAAVTASGGTAPYTYSWSGTNNYTAGDTDTIRNICPGTYFVTVTDSKGCVKVAGINVFGNSQIVIADTITNVSCYGSCNGSIKTGVTGGAIPYTYKWGNRSSATDLSNLCPGKYYLTVTDFKNCSAVDSFTITAPDSLHVTATKSDGGCFGSCVGSITVSASGGTPSINGTPYSIVWNNINATGFNPQGLCAGIYCYTVSDANNCSRSGCISIVSHDTIGVVATHTDLTCNELNGPCDGTINLTISKGTAPYTITWSSNLFGETGSVITNLCPDTYCYTVTDVNGCSKTGCVTINEPSPLLIASNCCPDNITCHNECNGKIDISIFGGVPPFTYAWTGPNGYTSVDSNITQLCPGMYTVTVTDKNGCTYDATHAPLINPDTIISGIAGVNPTDCNPGSCNGSASVNPSGGAGHFTVKWSNGQTTDTIKGICATTYKVTITDGLGCSIVDSIKLLTVSCECPVVTTMKTNTRCYASCDGSITLHIAGGASSNAYTVAWSVSNSNSATDTVLNNLCANTYCYTVTFTGLSCTKTGCVTITQPDSIHVGVTHTDLTCNELNGPCDGTITLSVSHGQAPYTITWSANLFGETGSVITNLCPDTYCYTVTDANGCTKTGCVTIGEPAPLLIASNCCPDDITCHNACNGKIDISIFGGVPPFTYAWTGPNGYTSTDSNITQLCPGMYTVTVTDKNGCSYDNAHAPLINPDSITSGIAGVNVANCDNGICNGSASVNPSGGTSPYTIIWSNEQTTDTIKNLCIGKYKVTITDFLGCSIVDSIRITCRSLICSDIQVQISGPTTACVNGGSVALSASPTTDAISYSWTGPNGFTANTDTIHVSTSGKYYVDILYGPDFCNGKDSINVQFSAEPVVTVSKTNVSCEAVADGECDGTIRLTITEVNTSTVTWSGPGTFTASGANLRDLCGGTYCYTVSSGGCSVTGCVTISQPQPLDISVNSTNVKCYNECNGTASVTVSSGDAPFTYSWSNGATTPTLSGLCAQTNLCVTVTSRTGCMAMKCINITQPAVLSLTTKQTNVTCNGSCNGTASVTASGGTSPYTYSWSNGATTYSTSGLCATTYCVTVTDNGGCSTSQCVTISQPYVLSLTTSQVNATCNGSCNGSASVTVSGGTAPYTYRWSGGNNAGTSCVSGLCATTYCVTVTDKGGCTASKCVTITQPVTVSVNITSTNITCNGSCNGTATANVTGGTGPFTYHWNNGACTQSICGLCSGTYCVTVTSCGGCNASDCVTISEPTPICVTLTTSNVTCYGSCNGSATATVTGGIGSYTYKWNTGATTTGISNLCSGSYSVVVTSGGCSMTKYFTIFQPSALCLTITGTNLTCNGNCNGTASISVSGGAAPYTYKWSNNATTSCITGLCVNTYCVTVTASGGCTASKCVTITQPSAVSVTIASTNVTCNGSCNGTATAKVTGGTAPFTYHWSNGACTPSISGLTASSYCVTVTSCGGCNASACVTITQPTPVCLTVTTANVTCYGSCNGTAKAIATGGNGSYTYKWSNNLTTSSISNLCNGSYSVTVTSGECTITKSFPIYQPSALCLTTTQTNVSCSGSCNGTASVGVTGGTAPYTYKWSNGATTSCVTGLCATTYCVTVTASGGCVASKCVTITQPSALSVTITSVNITCNGSCNGTANVTVTGGTGPYSYHWNTGAATPNLCGLCAGTYSVTVTSCGGCSTSKSVTISQPVAIIVTATTTNVTCNGSSNGTATVTVSGGTAPYTYKWNNGATKAEITGLCAGTYTVTVTSTGGCCTTKSVTITQPAALCVTITTTGITCSNLCGGTALVTVTGGTGSYTYHWSTGATGTSIRSLCAGTYYITVSSTGGCSVVKSFTISSCNCGGNSRVEVGDSSSTSTVEELTLDVFPNPFATVANLEFVASEDLNGTLEVFNITGERVVQLYTGEIVAGQKYVFSFDAGNLPSGMYIGRLTTNKQVKTVNIIRVLR